MQTLFSDITDTPPPLQAHQAAAGLIERLTADIKAHGRDKVYCAVWRQTAAGVYSIVNYVDASQIARYVRSDMSEMLDTLPAAKLLTILKRLQKSAAQAQADHESQGKDAGQKSLSGDQKGGSSEDSQREREPQLDFSTSIANPSEEKVTERPENSESSERQKPPAEPFELQPQSFVGVWPGKSPPRVFSNQSESPTEAAQTKKKRARVVRVFCTDSTDGMTAGEKVRNLSVRVADEPQANPYPGRCSLRFGDKTEAVTEFTTALLTGTVRKVEWVTQNAATHAEKLFRVAGSSDQKIAQLKNKLSEGWVGVGFAVSIELLP